MDKEKLNKAAESAMEGFGDFTQVNAASIKTAFKDGADWLMQQPLSERLTEAEKESVIKFYKTVWGKSVHKIQSELTAIFGSELFTEK